jgi:TolB-like protein/Flp pilus assembly protein TadD
VKHLIKELQRRGVWRAGLVYLAGAWLVVQVLETLVPIFGLPETSIRWVVIALAIGVVPVVALSWAFEWTDQGLRSTADVAKDPAVPKTGRRKFDRLIIVAFAVALGYFAFDRFVLQPGNELAPGSHASLAVAVLPFQTLGPEAGREYFTDGVHEELIAQLSQIQSLAVRSRTSVMPYRKRTQSLGEIAHALAADMIVEGSVRHVGQRVRVTAQLIDTHTDRHLWTGSFDAELSVQNLFDIQAQAAREIAGALETRLSTTGRPASTDLPTESLEAYDRFLLGKYHYRKSRLDDLRLSVEYLESAVALDPEFAEAWDWLAFAHSHSGTSNGWLLPKDAYPKAQAAALRALELDPTRTESRALLGYLRGVYDWDWPGSLAALEYALTLSPDTPGTIWSYAYVLAIVGRHEEALRLVNAFADAHPDDARSHAEVAYRLLDAGRFQDALARVHHALSLGGEPGPLHDLAGVALIGLGRYEAAADRLEQAAGFQGRSHDVLGHLGFAYARGGRPDSAREVLAELRDRRPRELVSPLSLAVVLNGLGERDAALTQLERAADERHREACIAGYSPMLADLRDELRFQAVLARMGLPNQTPPAEPRVAPLSTRRR